MPDEREEDQAPDHAPLADFVPALATGSSVGSLKAPEGIFLRLVGAGCGQFVQRGSQSDLRRKSSRPFAALDAIKKRREINQLRARLGEIEIGDARAVHVRHTPACTISSARTAYEVTSTGSFSHQRPLCALTHEPSLALQVDEFQREVMPPDCRLAPGQQGADPRRRLEERLRHRVGSSSRVQTRRGPDFHPA